MLKFRTFRTLLPASAFRFTIVVSPIQFSATCTDVFCLSKPRVYLSRLGSSSFIGWIEMLISKSLKNNSERVN